MIECHICFNEKDFLIELTCNHELCVSCLSDMIKNKLFNCPYCRKIYMWKLIRYKSLEKEEKNLYNLIHKKSFFSSKDKIVTVPEIFFS